MPDVRALFSGASPAPEVPQFDPNQVSPGLVGFLATFAMVIVVVFLMRDFSRRVRRIQHRSEAAERL